MTLYFHTVLYFSHFTVSKVRIGLTVLFFFQIRAIILDCSVGHAQKSCSWIGKPLLDPDQLCLEKARVWRVCVISISDVDSVVSALILPVCFKTFFPHLLLMEEWYL